MTDTASLGPATLDEVRTLAEAIRGEVAKAIVGQTEIVEHLLIALFARGHVLRSEEHTSELQSR